MRHDPSREAFRGASAVCAARGRRALNPLVDGLTTTPERLIVPPCRQPYKEQAVFEAKGIYLLKLMLVGLAFVGVFTASGVAHSASSQSAGSLVGTWARTTTCAELTSALRSGGVSKLVNEMVVGNGFIPGVRSPEQLRDPARPCLGAVPRKHSHAFLRSGESARSTGMATQLMTGVIA